MHGLKCRHPTGEHARGDALDDGALDQFRAALAYTRGRAGGVALGEARRCVLVPSGYIAVPGGGGGGALPAAGGERRATGKDARVCVRNNCDLCDYNNKELSFLPVRYCVSATPFGYNSIRIVCVRVYVAI